MLSAQTRSERGGLRHEELGRDSLCVLANHVSVDCLRDRRARGVAESLLSQFVGCPETIHQGCVRVTERMEPVASWHVDTELSEQGPEQGMSLFCGPKADNLSEVGWPCPDW